MAACDGQWELIDYEARTGRAIWLCADGDRIHLRTEYPVSGILEENRALFDESRRMNFENGRRVASIPLNLFYGRLQEAWRNDDRKFISRWLNDPDNRAFRTFRGYL